MLVLLDRIREYETCCIEAATANRELIRALAFEGYPYKVVSDWSVNRETGLREERVRITATVWDATGKPKSLVLFKGKRVEEP